MEEVEEKRRRKFEIAELRAKGDWKMVNMIELYEKVERHAEYAFAFELNREQVILAVERAPLLAMCRIVVFITATDIRYMWRAVERLLTSEDRRRDEMLTELVFTCHYCTESRGPFWWACPAETDAWAVAESSHLISLLNIRGCTRARRASADSPVYRFVDFMARVCGSVSIHFLAMNDCLTEWTTLRVVGEIQGFEKLSRAQRIVVSRQEWMQLPEEGEMVETQEIERMRWGILRQIIMPTREERDDMYSEEAYQIAVEGMYIVNMSSIVPRGFFGRRCETYEEVVAYVSNVQPLEVIEYIRRNEVERASARARAALFHRAFRHKDVVGNMRLLHEFAFRTNGGAACEEALLAAICSGAEIRNELARSVELDRLISVAIVSDGVSSVALGGESTRKSDLARRLFHTGCMESVAALSKYECAQSMMDFIVVKFGSRTALPGIASAGIATAVWDALVPEQLGEEVCRSLFSRADCGALFKWRCMRQFESLRSGPTYDWILDQCDGNCRVLLRELIQDADYATLVHIARRRPSLFTGPLQREIHILSAKKRFRHMDMLLTSIESSPSPAATAVKQMLRAMSFRSYFLRSAILLDWSLFRSPEDLVFTAVVPLIREFVRFDAHDQVDPAFDSDDWKEEMSSLVINADEM